LKAELEALKALQALINRILELEKTLNSVPPEVQALEQEWKAMASRLEELNQTRSLTTDRLKSARESLELATQQGRKFDADLSHVTNTREYSAVLKEIDASRKKVGHLNEEISQAAQELKDLELKFEECSKLCQESERGFQAALDTFRESQADCQTELDQKLQEKAGVVAALPPAVFGQFSRIAARRNGIGLSLCINATCDACNVRIRANVIDQLRAPTRLIQCESCQRILCYHEEPPGSP